MDDSPTPPLAFANQVIKMFAEHLLGDDARLNLRAYRIIRVVFRRLGGSWFELCQGHPRHTNLLIEVVKACGAQK
jgi:hypothetical protein